MLENNLRSKTRHSSRQSLARSSGRRTLRNQFRRRITGDFRHRTSICSEARQGRHEGYAGYRVDGVTGNGYDACCFFDFIA